MTNTDFSDANLTDAKLINVDLERVDLSGANLNGTYFVETKNITSRQLNKSCNWQLAIYKVKKNRENNFVVDEPANKEYVARLKTELSDFNSRPVDCSKWK